MITLYNFGSAFGLPDPSPFIMKAEMLLKMAKLEYNTDKNGFRKAPKGKLPYIKDGDNFVSDSTLIRFYLENKYGIDFDKNLTAEAKAISWAVEKMLEEHLYFAMLYSRWVEQENFTKGPAKFFDSAPIIIRSLIAKLVRKKIIKSLYAQGMGRHDKAEIEKLAIKDLEAVSVILGDKPYLMGDAMCGADAVAFSFVCGVLTPVFETPIRSAAEKMPNLVAYRDRMMKQFYPDFLAK